MSNEVSSVLATRSRQSREQIDAEAHIAGLDDHRRLRRVLDLRLIVGGEARGADDVDLLRLGGERGIRHRRSRNGEVDDAVGLVEDLGRIARQLDVVFAEACQRAGIPADQRRARVFQRARQLAALIVGDRLDQRAPHAPAGTGHHQPHLGHSGLLFEAGIARERLKGDPEKLRLRAVIAFDDDQIGLGVAFPQRDDLPVVRRSHSRPSPPDNSETR